MLLPLRSIASPGRTRITIMLGDDIRARFRARAEAQGAATRRSTQVVLWKPVLGSGHFDSIGRCLLMGRHPHSH